MRRLVLLAGIWGWSFLFIRVAVRGMTPTTVAFTRVALGAAVLLVAVGARGLRMPRDLHWWRHFAVAALISNAVPFSLLAWGEQHISSALTSVLNASTPLFSALMVWLFLHERLRPPQLFGLVLGFFGVAVAAGAGSADLARSSIGGDLAAVGAGACYGMGFTYAQRHLTGLTPLVASAGQLLMATVLLLPVAAATSASRGIHVTPWRLLSVGLLGVFGTGVAYVLYFRLIAEVGATRTAVVTYLIPVVAVAVGVLVLGEAFHLRLLVGGGLIVIGIVLLQGRLLRSKALPPVGA
jgi:drug/metabolite transporter (DMT)-like permease